MSRKQRIIFFLAFSIILLLTGIFRNHLLQSAGRFLICEDMPQQADLIFVLGGNAFERGVKAAELFNEGFAKKVICTSDHIPGNLLALNLEFTEAELTRFALEKMGVDSENIRVFSQCSSTQEESEFLLNYCKENGIRSAILVTNKFHTRRVAMVFRKKLEKNGIKIFITGAPSREFKEEEWWRSEFGLIAWNNECIKLFYYWMKY